MILVAMRRPRGGNALLIAIPASALVSYYMYIHDMCILILPILVILNRLRGNEETKCRYDRMQMITAVLLLVAPTCLMFAIHYFWIASLPLLAFTFSTAVCQSTPGAWPIPEEG
jgi:hypothetical protein